MNDTERLDWLTTQQDSLRVRTITETMSGDANLAYYRGMRVQLFTVTAGHVYGTDLRHAIDEAVRKVS